MCEISLKINVLKYCILMHFVGWINNLQLELVNYLNCK